MNINIDAIKKITYDAIVVGSGISGGWAAKELTEKGLKVAVMERGREVKHVEGYSTANTDPWDFMHRGKPTTMAAEEYWAGMRTGYTVNEDWRHFFENDKDNPYLEKKGGFDWIRAYHTGGKSLLWGRQTYRWSKADFEANAKDGIAVDWPIRYEDLAPWYTYVEKFSGISGQAEGLDMLPDSHFLPAMGMTAPELHFKDKLKSKMNRPVTVGRVAHLTQPSAQTLHEHRYLGNSAVHELARPSTDELKLAVEIVEHVLEQLYELPEKAAELHRAIARRKK